MFISAVFNMYALAETLVVCYVTTASTFLSCHVYLPSIINISKRIYLNLYLSIYTLGGRGTLKVAQKTATHSSVIFPPTPTFAANLATLVRCTLITQ